MTARLRRRVELTLSVIGTLALGHGGAMAQQRLVPPPSFESGRLWAQPRVEESGPDTSYARLEADVVARARARQPGAQLPVWRGQVFGWKFALDQQHVTVAGLKLPSFILALLPLANASVSPEQSKAAERRDEQRRDIDRQESRRKPTEED